MKPLGRKHFKQPSPCKHHPKEDGKNVPGWWEDVISPCNKRSRKDAKRDILKEINNNGQ